MMQEIYDLIGEILPPRITAVIGGQKLDLEEISVVPDPLPDYHSTYTSSSGTTLTFHALQEAVDHMANLEPMEIPW